MTMPNVTERLGALVALCKDGKKDFTIVYNGHMKVFSVNLFYRDTYVKRSFKPSTNLIDAINNALV